MAQVFNVNIKAFAERFVQEYDFLYTHGDAVAGYHEALAAGDRLIARHPDFVGEFARYRGDLITSDREVAAFAFALSELLPAEVIF